MSLFPKRLKELRIENKLSQDDLSEILRYRRTTISGYEIGRNEPSLDDLNKLAEYFNVSIDYLLGKTDIRNNSMESEILKIKSWIEENKDYLNLMKKIKDNGIDINIVNAFIDGLIYKK